MKFKVYKLQFKAPLHIGEEGIGAEKIETYVHSDTLMGALVNMYALLGKEVNFSDPPFKVTSAFPFSGDLFFFPVPIGTLHHLMQEADDLSIVKKLKKVKFIEKSLFEKLLRGEAFSLSEINWKLLKKFNQFLIPSGVNSFNGVFSVSEVPRIRVDRGDHSVKGGNIFYFSQLFFHERCGLFFLVDMADEHVEQFEAALSLLADEGLGADRNVGKGFFSWEKTEIELQIPENADSVYLASLYYPKFEEISNKIDISNSYYKILTRKGFVFNFKLSGLRRSPVRMLEEGSILKVKDGNDINGDNPVVIPAGEQSEFPIYRYGKAFYFPIIRRTFNG